MRKAFFGLPLLLMFLLMPACASAPIPSPEQRQGMANLVIDVSLKQLGIMSGLKKVYFVKADEEGKDSLQKTVIPSSHYSNGRIYLFNVPPGKYYAVMGEWEINRTLIQPDVWVYFFPKEMVLKTEVFAKPGKMTFMGRYEINTKGVIPSMDEADEFQKHYFRLKYPTKDDEPSTAKRLLMGGEAPALVEIVIADNGREAELQHCYNARNDFGNSEWKDLIDSRVGELAKK